MSQQTQFDDRSLEQTILKVLKDLVERHSSSRGVAEKMGQAHNYVARILRGETKLRLDVLGRILTALGVSEGFFLKLVMAESTGVNGVDILRFYGADGPPPVEFIDQVRNRVATAPWSCLMGSARRRQRSKILGPQTLEPQILGANREVLAGLEERRHTHKDEARAELESLVCSWLDTLDEHGLDERLIADIAEALAIWGTTQRFEGLRRDASLALQLSMGLASKVKAHRVSALGLQKASYLLRDLGCDQAGLILLEKATDKFLQAGEVDSCAKVFVDRGILLLNLKTYDSAISELETALRLLPEAEWRNRSAAYSNLAYCHEQRGDLDQARACLTRARQIYGDREDAILANILWNQGNIALVSNDAPEAERAYSRALELLEHYGKPLEFAFVALSLAEAYVKQEKIESMRMLADRMLAWLPAIRGNRVADAALMEWIRCAKWGEVTHRALREARLQLKRAAKS